MIELSGKVVRGVQHFRERMANFPSAFHAATNEDLYPGTINVDVGRIIKIHSEIRIKDPKHDEPDQDLLFERCQINGIDAFRIRPFNTKTGAGGHGDNILEIASSKKIDGVDCGNTVKITLFRDTNEYKCDSQSDANIWLLLVQG